MAYPTFSDWWNSYHQSKVIQGYVEAVQEADPKQIEKMIQDAHAYNENLVSNSGRFSMSDEERIEYNSNLNLTGNGVMGYVNIPSIGVNLPIYHGTDEVHLQVAVGHIEGSSLPVGGPSTHCVVSAHRGLPSAKLFTDLDQVKEGDIFTFTVLDQTLTYEVDQIRIVEPNNLSDLEIQKDADYATLITCTPYGVNTHRMLVRGHRIENLSDRTVVPAGAVQIPVYVAVLAVGIPLLFVYLVFALIYYRRRRPELDTQKALETVRKHAMDVQTDKNVASDGADEDAMSKEE
jgi:sortase A